MNGFMNHVEHLQQERLQLETRRHFLKTGGRLSLGAMALDLMRTGADGAAVTNDPMAPRKPHFPAKAKRIIYLHMSGGPPHLDIFDHKPGLVKRSGEDVPDSILKGRRFAFTSGVPKLMGSPRQ